VHSDLVKKDFSNLKIELSDFFIRPDDLQVKLGTFDVLGKNVTIGSYSIAALFPLKT
jgi:hypothetical protein